MEVTAVIPAHNSRHTVARALASVAAQTLRPARVIVVDDASSDGSSEVARACEVPGLEVVRLDLNRGPGAARNAGARLATTEWLAFLDADDTWEPTFLHAVAAAVEATDADFAGAGGVRQMVYRKPIVRLIDAPAEGADRTADFWRIARRFSPIVPSCAFIRRSLFERIGGFPEDVRTGEDITLFARLWLEGRFAFVNRPLYQSGQLRNGLSAGPRSYRDTALFTVRLGATLLKAVHRRKPGTRYFMIAYGRRVARRHVTWGVRRVRTAVNRVKAGRGVGTIAIPVAVRSDESQSENWIYPGGRAGYAVGAGGIEPAYRVRSSSIRPAAESSASRAASSATRSSPTS